MSQPFCGNGLRWPLALALACLCCSCSDTPGTTSIHTTPAETTNTLAVIGAVTITPPDLTQAMHARGAARYQTPESREALLEQLVQQALEVQAAKAAGYDQAPAVLKAHQRALVAELRRRRLEPRLAVVSVNDTEVEAYYRDHPTEFTKPSRVRAAIIRINVPARARPEKKQQFAQRAAEAREAALHLPDATRTFGSVAVKYSDDRATRYRGGDTGWIEVGNPRTQRDPAVMKALLTLSEPGQISPLLTTDTGHSLVRLIGREAPTLRPLAEVSGQIRHQLLAGKKAAVEARFHDELRKTVAVSVNAALLQSVAAPNIGATLAAKPPSLPE